MQKSLVIDMEREGDATYIWRPATAPSPLSSHLHPILNPVQESLVISDTDMEGEGDATYIWGTNLSVSVIQNRFNVFVREFREEGEAEPKYLRLLEEVGCLWRVGRVCDAARWTGSRELGLENWVCSEEGEAEPKYLRLLEEVGCPCGGVCVRE